MASKSTAPSKSTSTSTSTTCFVECKSRYPSRMRLSFIILLCACGGGDGGGASPSDSGPADGAPDAGDASIGPTRTALWQLPRGEIETFALPWPSDVHRTDDGHIDFSALPNPARNVTLTDYLALMSEELRGYGTNGAI